MFNIFIDEEAESQLAKLPTSNRKKFSFFVVTLKMDPVPVKRYDIAKLAGFDASYRVRIGRFRVYYRVNYTTKEIFILEIQRRKEKTYKRMKRKTRGSK